MLHIFFWSNQIYKNTAYSLLCKLNIYFLLLKIKGNLIERDDLIIILFDKHELQTSRNIRLLSL